MPPPAGVAVEKVVGDDDDSMRQRLVSFGRERLGVEDAYRALQRVISADQPQVGKGERKMR
jgi:hypothetical protein